MLGLHIRSFAAGPSDLPHSNTTGSQGTTVVWDCEAALEIIEKTQRGTVVAVLCGAGVIVAPSIGTPQIRLCGANLPILWRSGTMLRTGHDHKGQYHYDTATNGTCGVH